MTKYEMTLLLPEEAESIEINKYITSLEGKIEKEEKWGKKMLAYPIKKNTSAYYIYYILDIEENKVKELKKQLNFNEKLIRYLLLKIYI